MAWDEWLRSWSTRRRRRSRPRLWPSLVAGALAFVLVWTAGRALLDRQPVRWVAKAAVVILPSSRLDTDLAASYYSTLSQGQIVNTYAEVLRLQRFQSAVIGDLGIRAGAGDVNVTVEVVADTSMITIAAEASSPRVAERVADGILGRARPYISGLPVSKEYELAVASQATGTAQRAGIDPRTFSAVLALVALVAAVSAQQVWQQIAAALRVRRVAEAPSAAGTRPPPPPRKEPRPVVELWGDGEERQTAAERRTR